MTMDDIGKRAHILNNSHGKCVVSAYDRILYEGSIWNGLRAVIYFIFQK